MLLWTRAVHENKIWRQIHRDRKNKLEEIQKDWKLLAEFASVIKTVK